MLTLFLDFDGVLHPEFCNAKEHFCCLAHFEDAVRRIPACSIVISSTWRLQQSIEKMRRNFSPGIGSLIVGATPMFKDLDVVPDRLLGYEREAECEAWLRTHERAHLPWIAIDDRPWLYRPFNSSLFLVDGATGLTPDRAQKLVHQALLAR